MRSLQYGMSTLLLTSLILFASVMLILSSSETILVEQKLLANLGRMVDLNISLQQQKLSHQLQENSEHKLHDKSAWQPVLASFTASGQQQSRPAIENEYHQALQIHGNSRLTTYPLLVKGRARLYSSWEINNPAGSEFCWAGKIIEQFQQNKYHCVEQDWNLERLEQQAFFKFIFNESMTVLKQLIQDQGQLVGLSDISSLHEYSGLTWLGNGEQDIILSDLILGSEQAPVILIVDAGQDHFFMTRGKVKLYGLLYINGNWDIAGDFSGRGAIIVAGNMLEPAAPEMTNVQLTYDENLLNFSIRHSGKIPQTMSTISGSWIDKND